MELVSDRPAVRAMAAAAGNDGFGPVNEDVTSKTKSTPRNDKNTNYPLVTGEKKMTSNDHQQDHVVKSISSNCRYYASSFTVTCPDGSTVQLSAPLLDDSSHGMPKNDDNNIISTTSQIILGRGKFGIPPSASHVSRQACVLRMILEQEDASDVNHTSCVTSEITVENLKRYALELVVLGSQPCRISRQSSATEVGGEKVSKTIFAKSISQIIAENGKDFSPSSMKIYDGDVIEPCDRPIECTLDDAREKGCYHPFTVRFSTNTEPTKEKIDATTLFSEASRKIEAAAIQLVDEEDGPKEDSQDTVDVKSTMATENDVEMKASENDGDLVKSVGEQMEKTSPNALDGKDEKVVTMTTIVCGSMGTSDSAVKLDKSMDNAGAEAEAEMGCSTDQNVKEGGENDGSVKATSLNLPPDTAATAESLKESPASPQKDSETSSSSEESSEEEYEFDDPRDEIIEILQEIDSPGTFAVCGSCDGKLIMPGLVVDGIGPIGLPLSTTQAKELANRCEQAPFGRGAKTIVDKSVRDTFQLDPAFFQITNPAWKTDLDAITKSVCQDLGVQYNLKVEARLYKLLLYQEGSFFAPHRDSEKEEGMFGTLVIVLPSQFTGGELVVKHKGETQTFKQEGLSSFGSQYAAFYADCKHELKRVTSGHRLCVVFNLVKCGLGMLPKAADNSSLIKRLNAAASEWAANYDGNKIVLMTDHLYTPAGIKNGSGSAKYKGSDAYVVELLQSAISKGADIDYDHGTLSLSESGCGECDGYGYWGRGDYIWGETTERDLSLYLSSYGNVSVEEEEEVVPADFFEDLEPENESFEPTGNAGIEAERQYADTEAIVVWPRSKRWVAVTNNDTSRMCSYLLKACSKGTSDSEPIDECVQKAKSLIPRAIGSNKTDLSSLARSIVMIGDKSLAMEFLSSYLKNSDRSIDAIFDHIQTFLELCGTEAITSLIVESINTARFVADPTGTANFVLKYLKNSGKKVAISQQQKDSVIAAFAGSTRPPEKNVSRPLKTSLDKFPLGAILALFVDEKPGNGDGSVARCVLEGYVWISCLEVPRNYSYYSSSTKPSDGPVLLESASRSIIHLCNCFGWAKHKGVLVDAVEKLCDRGKSDNALAFLESLAPKDEEESDRSDICSKLAEVAFDKILASLQAPAPTDAIKSARLGVCKKLVVGIGKGRFCLSQAIKFVEVAKSLDVDSVLFPLVSDPTLRSNACDSVIHSLDLLTRYCAQVIKTRLSSVDLGDVAVWSLSSASASRSKNSTYSRFLRCPCKQELDWQVRKSDHNGFIADLKPLIHSGDVRVASYQPAGRGPYHFKITKLKSRRVPSSSLVGLTCSCSSGSSYYRHSSYRQTTTPKTCLLSKHKAVASKYQEDMKKMNVITKFLPSPPAAAAAVAPAAVSVAAQQQQPAARHLQQFNVLYTTPKLGLKLKLVGGKDMIQVKEITPAAPNAHLIKAGDFVVGLNGKRFEELGVKVTGEKGYEQAITKVKEAKRPVSLMLERQITTNRVEDTTCKRPAETFATLSASSPATTFASLSAASAGGKTWAAGVDAQIQHPIAKKAKTADVIDLT
ncbi:hypothetical protein ACHAWT_005551 [Skeletonema menzelii]